MTEITRNEHKVLRAILTNDFQAGGTWANCINDASEPSGIEGKALAGVVSSLAKKGLLICGGRGSDATVQFASEETREFARGLGRA